MDEKEQEEQKEDATAAKQELVDLLKARGEAPTDRNIIKMVYVSWLCHDQEGINIFSALCNRVVSLTINITGCELKDFHLDEASEILGEIFLDLSLKQKKVGLTRKDGEKPILGYLLQGLH